MASTAALPSASLWSFNPEASASSLPNDSDLPLEAFYIPKARIVHGNAFPLGIRVKQDAAFEDIDAAVQAIELLTDKGVFNQILTNR